MSTQGLRLRKVRKILGITQEDFAKKLNLTVNQVDLAERSSNLDDNIFSQAVLQKMVEIFSINMNYILAGIGSPLSPLRYDDVKAEIILEISEKLSK